MIACCRWGHTAGGFDFNSVIRGHDIGRDDGQSHMVYHATQSIDVGSMKHLDKGVNDTVEQNELAF